MIKSLLCVWVAVLWIGASGVCGAASTPVDAGGQHSVLTPQERTWLSENAAKVRVAPEGNYPPFSFSQSDAWLGISAHFLQLIEGHLGVRFQLLAPQNLDQILKQTQEDGADLVTSIKSTPEREKYLVFTPAYIKVSTVIVTRSGNSMGKWPEAFTGKSVAGGNGYGVQHYLEETYPLVPLTLVKDDLDGLRKLAFGEVDAVIMDIASASYFIEHENITGLRIHSEFEYVYPLSFAVRKDMAVLRDILTTTLENIPESEKQGLLKKWIHLDSNPYALLRKRLEPWLPFIFLIATALASGLVVAFVERRDRLQEAVAAAYRLEEANQLLIEQQAFTRTIADALPNMIGYWSADLRCKFANKGYLDSFHVDASEIVGQRLHDVADEGYILANKSHMDAALSGQVQVFQREVRRPDGQTAFQSVQYLPHVANSVVLGIFVLIEDITELKRAAVHLEELNKALAVQAQAAQEANVAKSAFLANMSHEIRTPLGAISGMARLIRREPLSGTQRERLDKLESAAKHLGSTISDILDLSKIEANKLVLEESPIQIDRLVKSVADIVLESANEKGLQLHTEIESIPYVLVGDETRLRQALLNFAGNAIKFTEVGDVSIRAKVLDDSEDAIRVRLEVQDSGPGISTDQISRLFDPFVQGDSTTTRKYGGSGLGLAITRRLAEAMDGSVGVESELGRGSNFWLEIRLNKSADFQSQEQADAGNDFGDLIRRALAGRRLLLVDDDEFNREIGVVLLEDVGLLVDVAEDGQVAVDKAKSTAYALILMDMQMPRMDGLQATREIRALPGQSSTPIVAMTANVFSTDRERCLNAGMDDFLTKPVDPAALYNVIVKTLSPTDVSS